MAKTDLRKTDLIFKNKDTFNNVEYMEVIDQGLTVAHYEGTEINGKKKSDVQYMIGKGLPIKVYRVSVKANNKSDLITFPMKAISKERYPNKRIEKEDNSNVFVSEIKKLNDNINALKSGTSFDIQILIDNVRTAKDAEINYLKMRLTDKENDIKQLDIELTKAQDEINRLEREITNANSGISKDIDKYLNMALSFFQNKNNGSTTQGLSNISVDKKGIPAEFLNELGTINWKAVPEDSQKKIIKTFQTIKTSLPLNK